MPCQLLPLPGSGRQSGPHASRRSWPPTDRKELPMSKPQLEFGIDSFGDLPRDEHGNIVSYAEAIRATVEEAKIADQAGIDVIADRKSTRLNSSHVAIS